MKTCFKCGQAKPLNEFYKHPAMSDGHLGKCKECAKVDVKVNRLGRLDYYAQYERERFNQPGRKAQVAEYQRRRRKRCPEKDRARRLVGYAVRTGKIQKPDTCTNCQCQCTPEAHHADYSKPLEVQWLCFKCHREIGHGQLVLTT